MKQRRGRARMLHTAVIGLALLGALCGTASAEVGKRYVSTNFPDGSKGFISWNASCNTDGINYSPSWKGYMQEFGQSRVKKLKIEYDLYTEGTGFDTIHFRGSTYVKSVVEYGSYEQSTPSSASQDNRLDSSGKRAGVGVLNGDVLLVIKFTFDRGVLRKDTVAKQVVAFCSNEILSGSHGN